MESPTPQPATAPEPRSPAWIISIVLHCSAFLALVVAIDRVPRGAIPMPIGSPGIVLERMSAEGDLSAGEANASVQAALPDTFQPPELIPVRENQIATAQAERAPVPQITPVAVDETSNGDAGPPGSQTSGAAGGRPGSPDGDDRYAKVSVFGVEGTGNKFVYVFDRSSSMEGAPLAAAKRQLIESLNSLDTVHQFHIIFFNHRLRMFDVTSGGRRIAFASERNKKLAANFVGGMTADGGTDRFTALKQALAFRPDVIFFLTDADDPMSTSEMADLEQVYSRSGTAICVIEFGRTPTAPQKNFLTELAGQSGGKYGYVNTLKLGANPPR
jgi:hypothetical protein